MQKERNGVSEKCKSLCKLNYFNNLQKREYSSLSSDINTYDECLAKLKYDIEK